MKLTLLFGVLLLAGLASTAPTSKDDDKVIVIKQLFRDKFAKYTAEHDIVNMLPFNLNFEDYLFFAEADTDENGKRVDQGLYVMKNYNVTKLLDNGRDATAGYDNTTKYVYFATKDGIYLYNVTQNNAEKYGTITDSIIGIAKVNGSDVIYILTEDHVIYKVTDDGTKKTKVDGVVDAQQIVMDYENNLYYYTGDKQVYVISADGVKKIEGLPAATYINLLKPPYIYDNRVPVIVNDNAYIVYVNGTIETTDFQFIDRPTAFSMEGTFIHYIAYNKTIYEYNLFKIMPKEIKSALKNFVDNTQDSIQSIATYEDNPFEIMAKEIKNAIKKFLDDKQDSIQSIATRSRSELIPPAEETPTTRESEIEGTTVEATRVEKLQ